MAALQHDSNHCDKPLVLIEYSKQLEKLNGMAYLSKEVHNKDVTIRCDSNNIQFLLRDKEVHENKKDLSFSNSADTAGSTTNSLTLDCSLHGFSCQPKTMRSYSSNQKSSVQSWRMDITSCADRKKAKVSEGQYLSPLATEIDVMAGFERSVIGCANCSCVCIALRGLSRVLHAPSVDWRESAENWLCHDPSKSTERLVKHALSLKQGYCLVDELTFSINGEDISQNEAISTDSHFLKCPSCGNGINQGSQGNVLTFRKDKVTLSQSESDKDLFRRYKHCNSMAIAYLLQKMKTESHHQFIIYNVDEVKPRKASLLVWIMPNDIDIITNIICPNQNHNLMSSSEFKSHPGVKVLFQSKLNDTLDNSVVKAWGESLNSETILFPAKWCLGLHSQLYLSNSFYPIEQRFANGFQISFLDISAKPV